MPEPRPCARCKTAPRNGSNPSYCSDCQRTIGRETRERLGPQQPQQNCCRCGQPRDGRHKTYCVKCIKAYRAEQLADPCHRCGAVRAENDRTNSVYCYRCWRDWWLRRKYGITADEYDRMLAEQDDRCAICRCEANGRTWHVDHCHDTGRVRGILCDNCNRGIGQLQHDPEVIRRAADYIERGVSASA